MSPHLRRPRSLRSFLPLAWAVALLLLPRAALAQHAATPAPPRDSGGPSFEPPAPRVVAPPRATVTGRPHRALPAPPRGAWPNRWYGPYWSPGFWAYDPWWDWGPAWGYGFAWGGGPPWGWGWEAPLAGEPEVAPDGTPAPVAVVPGEAGAPPLDTAPAQRTHPLSSRFELHGSATLRHGGLAGGIALDVEGRRFGFTTDFDAFDPGDLIGSAPWNGTSAYGLFAARGTAVLVATARWGLRGELGGAVLTWPDVGTDAGAVAFGPQAGLSGELALTGPLWLTAYARAVPWPTPIYDWRAAVSVRLEFVELLAGWRALDVHTGAAGKNTTRFNSSGPMLGIAFRL